MTDIKSIIRHIIRKCGKSNGMKKEKEGWFYNIQRKAGERRSTGRITSLTWAYRFKQHITFNRIALYRKI